MGGLSKTIKYTTQTMLIASWRLRGNSSACGFSARMPFLLSAFQIPGGHPL